MLADVHDPADATKLLLQKGKQMAGFATLRDDGTTACGCWIYSGCYNEAGNNMARRDTHGPGQHGRLSQMGVRLARQPPHSVQSGVGGHCKASLGTPTRKLIEWNGSKWIGYDVPDIAPTANPEQVQPFIMNHEGTARLWVRGMMKDGPFPTHYEPFESPVVKSGCAENPRQSSRRASSKTTWKPSATPMNFPMRQRATG